MQYFGGKARIANEIVEVLKNNVKNHETYIEPFCGSAKIVTLLAKEKLNIELIAYDINNYLIDMFNGLKNGWIPPTSITKDEYDEVKNNKDKNKPLTGFVGFGCSFAGKWFGGYAKNKIENNYAKSAYNSLIKYLDEYKLIIFETKNYKELNPKNSLIYCDPPYKGTTNYGFIGKFNSEEFWNTMREWSKNNTVLISEYNAPDDFEIVWQKETKTSIRDKDNKPIDRIERLYKFKQ